MSHLFADIFQPAGLILLLCRKITHTYIYIYVRPYNDVMYCMLVLMYQHFRRTSCLHHEVRWYTCLDRNSSFLWNVCTHPPVYM